MQMSLSHLRNSEFGSSFRFDAGDTATTSKLNFINQNHAFLQFRRKN